MTEPTWAELWRELTERVRRPEREGEAVERVRSEIRGEIELRAEPSIARRALRLVKMG
jgi:hypothetical protein